MLSVSLTQKYHISARLMGFQDNWILHSTDDGGSWSAPQNITSQVWSDTWHIASTSNGHGLQTSSGRVIMPVYVHPTEQFGRFPQLAMQSAIYYSDDDGEHWHFANTSLVGVGTSESEIVELPGASGRHLLFNHRRNDLCGATSASKCPFSKTEHTRYQSLSTDNGLTFFNFSAVEALPDPGCKGGIVAWPTQQHPAGVLLTNAASATARQDITLRFSPDGQAWPSAAKLLLSVPGGYSDVALLSSAQRDFACVLFEAPQCGPIKLAVVDPSTLLSAKSDDAAAKVLRTRASFFIEPEAMLSRQSSLHDVLWDGVNRVKAPATMYSPWAPYPHYAVG